MTKKNWKKTLGWLALGPLPLVASLSAVSCLKPNPAQIEDREKPEEINSKRPDPSKPPQTLDPEKKENPGGELEPDLGHDIIFKDAYQTNGKRNTIDLWIGRRYTAQHLGVEEFFEQNYLFELAEIDDLTGTLKTDVYPNLGQSGSADKPLARGILLRGLQTESPARVLHEFGVIVISQLREEDIVYTDWSTPWP
ncbi:hypothetical protein, partial [Mycoplasma sp. ATU-Cv-703]|uniref:hypothetical protein n=1 Tax=Mycoplasma sp. ATU-Cv-703 TaxID=2498595 RepID=UPI0011E4DE22